jgi:hypothetical protein
MNLRVFGISLVATLTLSTCGLRSDVETSGTAAPSPVKQVEVGYPSPSFDASEGWYTDQSGTLPADTTDQPAAWVSTYDFTQPEYRNLYDRLGELPPDGIAIEASFIGAEDYPWPPNENFPAGHLPLDLDDAEVLEEWEGQIEGVPQFRIWTNIDERLLDVRVYFGRLDPTSDQYNAAAEALKTLRMPGSPPTDEIASEGSGFVPSSRSEGGKTIMPVTFVDGSVGEIVADEALGINEMIVDAFTAGGLDYIDRTIDFSYGDGSYFMHEGPLETLEGADGSTVEVWNPAPDMPAECPYLVYRFGDWFVGVRTCQQNLSTQERSDWARSLSGHVTDDRFLILSAKAPLVLQETGGHEGPELTLGSGRANWIELEPGGCPANLPDEGDIRTMSDGTLVSFSRIGGPESKLDYNWYAEWCEDGLLRVQIEYAYQDFVEGAAEGFRMRDIVLAE